MKIRPAELQDLDAVCAISESRRFCARWSRGSYRGEVGSEGSCFAVADDGGVRGYALARRVPPELRLVDLAVREEDEGRGLGSALLGRLAGQARLWSCAKLTLEVSAENEGALRLYRKTGFQVVGRRPKFYNDGSDAILMDFLL